MDRVRFAVLKAEVDAQMEEIEKIYKKINERRQLKGTANLESLGYQLHNLYCAFEDLFRIVAAAFENQVTDKSRYHIELLKRMSIEVEGVRPALISKESCKLLDSLRAFRHFFRHAYSYELDERKLMLVVEDAVELKKYYPADVYKFFALLEAEG